MVGHRLDSPGSGQELGAEFCEHGFNKLQEFFNSIRTINFSGRTLHTGISWSVTHLRIIIIIIIVVYSNSIDPHKVANITHWSTYIQKTMYQQSPYRLNTTFNNVTFFDN